MDRFRTIPALIVTLSVLVPMGPVQAERAYTTDTRELSLRAIPSGNGKTLVMVPPGSDVEVLSPDSYTKVRYRMQSGNIREGWISSRFLSPWPPNSSLAKELGAKNEALTSQLDELDKEKNELLQKQKDLTERLTELNAAYEELKGGSANYLKLKSDYDLAKLRLARTQENIEALVQENESLKIARDVRWAMAGAAVLLTGWFMGWATTRRKKKKGMYYLLGL